jgi:hypothetical protein
MLGRMQMLQQDLASATANLGRALRLAETLDLEEVFVGALTVARAHCFTTVVSARQRFFYGRRSPVLVEASCMTRGGEQPTTWACCLPLRTGRMTSWR